MKLKIFDIFLGLFILLLITPFVIVFCFMIFIYDGSNPLYISTELDSKVKNLEYLKYELW